MAYILDTNVVSDLVRAPQGQMASRVRAVGDAEVCTSVIVAAELRDGAAKKASARLSAQLEAVLGVMSVLPLEPPVEAPYARLRARWNARVDRLAATTF